MTSDDVFVPSAARARTMDDRMHAELAASVRYLVSQPDVTADHAAIERFVAGIEAGDRHAPLTFAAYYDCGTAQLDGQDTAAATAFSILARATPVSSQIRIAPIRDSLACDRSRRMRDLLCSDEDGSPGFLPPTMEQTSGFATRLASAMALLDGACPEVADEVRTLVRELVLVASDRSRKVQVDGASHYQLWGAVFLNLDYHPTPHALAEVIAHECAHSVLFGLTIDEPLVINDDAERYASALRSDPRPMDGVFHAMFVSARMCYVMGALLESGLLDREAALEVVRARDVDRENYEHCAAVVREHGRMTRTGRAVFDATHRWMHR